MSRTVIFDVGCVLIHWDMRRVFRPLLPDEAAVDAFLAETGWHAWNVELDRGGRWDDAVAALSARFPHRSALIEASHHRWQDAVRSTAPWRSSKRFTMPGRRFTPSPISRPRSGARRGSGFLSCGRGFAMWWSRPRRD
jgi:hypothetical protein